MEEINWNFYKNYVDIKDKDFKFDLENIDEKTFDITAKKWSLVIANMNHDGKPVEKNQLRNFYDKVLELLERAESEEENFNTKVLPFIKMLNSKVSYSRNRQQSKTNLPFEIFMTEAISQIKDLKTFIHFKLLFEALLGFYQKEYINRNDIDKCKFFIKQNREKYISNKKTKGRR
ncbi:CRISPR type III-A-associated protein Csm2 [Malaciobacter marinus]|jgi:CRISPR type III-A-associated protein Csm2|uniref:CRISPR system Cms protein Csm2 n=1 Tax=Malaciobacter marinus TaxID=505249 RepID=A0AB36ZW68_9BACT|nr:type III-A CRISPR-associated protein Csm2 [Malaciobacter marinus]PPK60522.1 CRISPR type III-A-associated protein Csm2 [Malaciobacter marinus]